MGWDGMGWDRINFVAITHVEPVLDTVPLGAFLAALIRSSHRRDPPVKRRRVRNKGGDDCTAVVAVVGDGRAVVAILFTTAAVAALPLADTRRRGFLPPYQKTPLAANALISDAPLTLLPFRQTLTPATRPAPG